MKNKQWQQDPMHKLGATDKQDKLARLRQQAQQKAHKAKPSPTPVDKVQPSKPVPKIDSQAQAIADLRKQVDKLKKDNQSLSKRLHKAQNRLVDNLPQPVQNDVRDAKIAELEQRNGEQSHELMQMQLTITEQRDEISALQEQISAIKLKYRPVDRQLRKLRNARDRNETEIADLTDAKAKLETELKNTQKQQHQKKETIKTLRREIADLENQLKTRKLPSNKMLFDVASVMTVDNYMLFTSGVNALNKRFSEIVGDGRRLFKDVAPVSGIAENRDGDMWFVTDTIATQHIDSNRDLQEDMVYTALLGANNRVYIISEIAPEDLPAERQRIRNKVKSTDRTKEAIIYPELAGKHVIHVSYVTTQFLMQRVTQSGGTFKHYDPNELSLAQYRDMLDSNKVDYVLLDTGHATHALFWETRDYLKQTNNRDRVQMFEHKPTPRILMEMIDYFQNT